MQITAHQSPDVGTIARVLMIIVHRLCQRNTIKTENITKSPFDEAKEGTGRKDAQ